MRMIDVPFVALVVVGAVGIAANSGLQEADRALLSRGDQRPRIVLLGAGVMPSAISADGAVVAGSVFGQAFRWTPATGLVPIGAAGASAISGDGSTIAGNLMQSTAYASGETELAATVARLLEGLRGSESDPSFVAPPGFTLGLDSSSFPGECWPFCSPPPSYAHVPAIHTEDDSWVGDRSAAACVLGNVPSATYFGEITGVSHDARIVAGHVYVSCLRYPAFRDRAAGTGWERLPVALGRGGLVTAVSADGRIVVGRQLSEPESPTPPRPWYPPGCTGLDCGCPGVGCEGLSSSAVGLDVEGTGAVRWVGGVLEMLSQQDLALDLATAVNRDGSLIVGNGSGGDPGVPWTWDGLTGATRRAWVSEPGSDAPPIPSFMYDVSDDGRVIGGRVDSPDGAVRGAALWLDGAPVLLKDFLALHGVHDLNNWLDTGFVRAVSADGRVVAGWGSPSNGAVSGFVVYLGRRKWYAGDVEPVTDRGGGSPP